MVINRITQSDTYLRSRNLKHEKEINLDGVLDTQDKFEKFISDLQENFQAESLKYISKKNITSYSNTFDQEVVLQLIIKQLLKLNDITDFEYEQNPTVYNDNLNKFLQSKVTPSSPLLKDNINQFVNNLFGTYQSLGISSFSDLVSRVSTFTSTEMETTSSNIEVKYSLTLSSKTVLDIEALLKRHPSTAQVCIDFINEPTLPLKESFINTGNNSSQIIQEIKQISPLSPSDLTIIQKAEDELSGKVTQIGTIDDQAIYNLFQSPTDIQIISLKAKLEGLVGPIKDKDMLLTLSASKENLQKYWENKPLNSSKNLSDFDKDFKKLQQKIISLKDEFKSPLNTTKDPNVKLILEFFFQQFVEYEDQKIQNIHTTREITKNRIEAILNYKTELGIDNARLGFIDQNSSDYAKALSENFKGVDSTKKSKLRKSRIERAKLMGYASARNKSIDIETLDSTGINDYIKEVKQTVFKEAITKDLDSLYESYEVSRPRKLLNNCFEKYPLGKDSFKGVIGGGVLGYLGRTAFKAGAIATTGVIGGVAAGGVMMKGAARRFLNSNLYQGRSSNVINKKQFNIDQIALNFTEATRDKTGAAYDSLLNDPKNISNHYIKRQLESLKQIQDIDIDLSKFDSDIEDIKNQIKLGTSDPTLIQNLIVKLQTEMTKEITDQYMKVYEQVLIKIEEHRAAYYKKVAKELGAAMIASIGFFAAGYLISGVIDLFSTSEEATKAASEAAAKTTSPHTSADNSKGWFQSLKESLGFGSNPTSVESNGISPTSDQPDPDLGRPLNGSDPSTTNSNTTPQSSADNSKGRFQSFKESFGIDSNSTSDVTSSISEATTVNPEFLQKGVTFSVLSDDQLPIEQLKNIKYRDGGITHHLIAMSDGSLTSKQAYEIAKAMGTQGDVPSGNINLIRDGEQITLRGKTLELYLKYTGGKTPDVKNMLKNYLKIFGK